MCTDDCLSAGINALGPDHFGFSSYRKWAGKENSKADREGPLP